MQRVSVVGCSGSGKSTLSARLAEVLDAPYTEIDALNWGPGWTPAAPDELRARVRSAVVGDTWVIDGNYQGTVGTLAWDRADTVVWLDPPRRTVMWRVLRRTVRRAASREELWSGNREGWRGLAIWREDSILRWAWSSHASLRQQYSTAMADPAFEHMTFHRLRSRRDVESLVSLARGEGPRT